jgi:hypothetical protein
MSSRASPVRRAYPCACHGQRQADATDRSSTRPPVATNPNYLYRSVATCLACADSDPRDRTAPRNPCRRDETTPLRTERQAEPSTGRHQDASTHRDKPCLAHSLSLRRAGPLSCAHLPAIATSRLLPDRARAAPTRQSAPTSTRCSPARCDKSNPPMTCPSDLPDRD